MKITRKRLLLAAGFLLLCTLLFSIRWLWGSAWQHITVSPEITHITSPLRPDGTVDYIAALNEHYGKNVTPKNNAALAIFKLVDMREYGDDYLHTLALTLHAPELESPDPTVCFVGIDAFRAERLQRRVEEDEKIQWRDQLDPLALAPWKAQEQPEVAAWLESQRSVLERVAAAARLPHYFVPLMRTDERTTILSARIGPIGITRELSKALAVRAMLNVSRNQPALVHEDALTIIRMGFLVGQQPTRIERLVGIALINQGIHIDMAILENCILTHQQVAAIAADIRSLGPMPSFVECLDLQDRYTLLDQFTLLARFGPDADGPSPSRAGSFSFGLIPVRFDPPMREANQWADRQVAAASIPRFAQRESALAALADDIARSSPPLVPGKSSSQAALRSLSRPFGDDCRGSLRPRDFAQQDLNLLLSALSARNYFESHPTSPPDIQAWLQTQPPDIFAEEPLHATLDNHRFTLACEPPLPLPSRSFTLGGVSLSDKSTPRTFCVAVRLP